MFFFTCCTFFQPLTLLQMEGLNSRSLSRQSICDLLSSCGKSLRTLTLDHGQRIDRSIIQAIAKHCCHLSELSLANCRQLAADDLRPLFSGENLCNERWGQLILYSFLSFFFFVKTGFTHVFVAVTSGSSPAAEVLCCSLWFCFVGI